MLEVEAYDHAQSAFGPSAGVWRPGNDRCVVGRWVALGELAVPHVGESGLRLGDTPVILRSKAQGFEVLGEGATWATAFAAAEVWRAAHTAATPSRRNEARKALVLREKAERAMHAAPGDEFGPAPLEAEAAQ